MSSFLFLSQSYSKLIGALGLDCRLPSEAEKQTLDALRLKMEPYDGFENDAHRVYLHSLYTRENPCVYHPQGGTWCRWLGFQQENPSTDLRSGSLPLYLMHFYAAKNSTEFRAYLVELKKHNNNKIENNNYQTNNNFQTSNKYPTNISKQTNKQVFKHTNNIINNPYHPSTMAAQRKIVEKTGDLKTFPFAAACINVTRILSVMFELVSPVGGRVHEHTSKRDHVWALLSQPFALERLFVVLMRLLLKHFKLRDAGYMQFPFVLTDAEQEFRARIDELADIQQKRKGELLADLEASTSVVMEKLLNLDTFLCVSQTRSERERALVTGAVI